MESNSIQTRRIVSIEKGHEYQPKNNDRVDNIEVFFYDVYNQAKYLMDDIIFQMEKNTIKSNSLARNERTLMSQFKERGDFLSINNVIAFCADRGNGKTSAMLSFTSIFCENESQICANKFLSDTKCLRDHTYVVLSSIDPTSIEPGGSFLSTVITRMFFYFQQAERSRSVSRFYTWSDQDFDSKEKERSDLLRQFQKCFSDVEILHNGNRKNDWTEDGLERIAELSDSTNLRSTLRDLVEMYLNYIGNSNTYLILSIDDADTNVDLGYQLLEDVRKYLSIPRVIVLMATNMLQMETVVEQSYLERYKTGLSFSDKGSMISVARCHEAAELYLEKVIPGSRRIYLPSLENSFAADINSVRIDYGDGVLLDADYQNQLLELLHRKTGLLLLPANGYVHNLLPTKFRELSHFLSYFETMSDCEQPFFEEDAIDIRRMILEGNRQEAEQKISVWRKRLDKIEHYLVYIWAGSNLRQSARSFFQDLTHQSWRNINRFVLYNFPRYYCKNCEETRPYTIGSYPYNTNSGSLCQMNNVDFSESRADVSYRKVVELVDALTACDGREEQCKLADAIYFYYSICLHRLLLDDLRNIGQKDTSISKVCAFLGDISLFQVENREQNPFGHFKLNDFEMTSDRNKIRPFFRKEAIENNATITYSIKPQERLETALYDPSYLFLNHMDTIAQKADDPSTGRDVNILSLVILLNWDIQKDIRHSLKTSCEEDKKLTYITALRKCYEKTVFDTCKKLENGLLKGAMLSDVVSRTIVARLDESRIKLVQCVLLPKEKDELKVNLQKCIDTALNISESTLQTLSEWNASKEKNIINDRNQLDAAVKYVAKYVSCNKLEDAISFSVLKENIINNNNLRKEFSKLTTKEFAEKIQTEAQKFADLIGIKLKETTQKQNSGSSEISSDAETISTAEDGKSQGEEGKGEKN